MYLLVLFGTSFYWEGMAWHVQNGPFRVLCGKKVRQLEKSTPAVLVALVTNNSYGQKDLYRIPTKRKRWGTNLVRFPNRQK